jgi:tether containing UBX domain for GLUT4
MIAGKNYTHRMPPMQPLGSAIPSILTQAGLATTVTPEECQLLLKDKPLDLTLAYRFANLPTGAKITLKTGHERVLGFHDNSAPAPKAVAPPPARSAAPADVKQQQQNAPSTSKLVNEQPAPAQQQKEQPKQQQQAPSPSPTPAGETDAGNIFAGRPIHVFSREQEIQEDAARASPAATELDESAYEVTEADVRRQLATYAKNQRAEQGKYLMTKQMREAEQAKKAASYGAVPVRVEFPGDTVLQASFPAVAPVAELHELVKTALLPEAAKNFYLFTTPPKVELKDMSVSFYAAGLVPAARVHVGFKGGAGGGEKSPSCLRPEVAALMGRPPSRAEALGLDEKKSSEGVAEDEAGPSGSRAAAPKAAAGGTVQGEPKRARPGGVPSWMKLSNR